MFGRLSQRKAVQRLSGVLVGGGFVATAFSFDTSSANLSAATPIMEMGQIGPSGGLKRTAASLTNKSATLGGEMRISPDFNWIACFSSSANPVVVQMFRRLSSSVWQYHSNLPNMPTGVRNSSNNIPLQPWAYGFTPVSTMFTMSATGAAATRVFWSFSGNAWTYVGARPGFNTDTIYGTMSSGYAASQDASTEVELIFYNQGNTQESQTRAQAIIGGALVYGSGAYVQYGYSVDMYVPYCSPLGKNWGFAISSYDRSVASYICHNRMASGTTVAWSGASNLGYRQGILAVVWMTEERAVFFGNNATIRLIDFSANSVNILATMTEISDYFIDAIKISDTDILFTSNGGATGIVQVIGNTLVRGDRTVPGGSAFRGGFKR